MTNTCTVLASQDVSVDFLKTQLNMVKFNGSVTRLEVEDLIGSGKAHHATILPLIQDILLAHDSTSRRLTTGDKKKKKRDWQAVEFVDNLALTQLAQWQATKTQMMRDYEKLESFSKQDWCYGKLLWKASVQIPTESNADEVHAALIEIQKDKDVFGVGMATNPHTGAVLMKLCCGWVKRDAQSTHVLNQAIAIFKEGDSTMNDTGAVKRLSQQSDTSMENSFSSTTSAGKNGTKSTGTGSNNNAKLQIPSKKKKNSSKGNNNKQSSKKEPDFNWETGAASFNWETGAMADWMNDE